MPGRAFIEAILRSPIRSAARGEFMAGLMVIRLADQSMRTGTYDRGIFRSARARVRLIKTENVGLRLGRILTLLKSEAGRHCPGAIGARVMAYGIELHAAGHLALAVDVFRTIASRSGDDPTLRMQAIQSLAYALRSIPQLDEAERAYDALLITAHEAKDEHVQREARLGLAKVLILRGNLQAALPLIEQLIIEGRAADDAMIVGKALLDRAYIAGSGHDEEAALYFSEEARRVLPDCHERERCGVTLAVAYRERGRPDESRRHASHVVDHAANVEERAQATFVLYNLAIDAEDRDEQDKRREWLEAAPLTIPLQIEYHNTVARDRANERDFDGAAHSLRSTLALAESHGLNEDVIRAEKAMWHVTRRSVPPAFKYRPARSTGPLLWHAAATREDVPAATTTLTIIPIVSAGRADIGTRRRERRGT